MFVVIKKKKEKAIARGSSVCVGTICATVMRNMSLAVETILWELVWAGDGLMLVWLAAGGSPGNEVPSPPDPQLCCVLLRDFGAQALECG